jgi:hypothetical protein
MTTIGDANDPATVLADADTFFLHSGYFAATDAAEAQGIAGQFDGVHKPGYWEIGQMTAALAQMVDLVAPLDLVRTTTYLSRLGAIASALLANRDDKRGFPVDPFRGRVMPAAIANGTPTSARPDCSSMRWPPSRGASSTGPHNILNSRTKRSLW